MIDEKKLLEKLEELKFANEERGYDTAKDVIQEIINLVDEQPKTDWIPCEERLPNESGYYFACIYNEDVDNFDFRKTWFAHVLDYDIEESEWRELYEFETVTAWQPLPQPYKKEGAENGNEII